MRRRHFIFALIMIGVMLFSIAGCNLFGKSSSEPAKGSVPISGTPFIEGSPMKMPCTVGDLINKGYKTDYHVGNIIMMRLDSNSAGGSGSTLAVFLDPAKEYTEYDFANVGNVVVAVEFQDCNNVNFSFNDIGLGMSRKDFMDRFGIPAYERDNKMEGDFCYYLGDSDMMYCFLFQPLSRVNADDPDNQLCSIMVGSKDYVMICN